jgi:hypothetical protein
MLTLLAMIFVMACIPLLLLRIGINKERRRPDHERSIDTMNRGQLEALIRKSVREETELIIEKHSGKRFLEHERNCVAGSIL